MAIGEIPSWVRGVNAGQEISSGASAGLGVARIQQEQQSEAARQGMEAIRLKQSAAMEQARLQQAAEQHQMEFQARQKTNEQMQLRADQRLNIDNAYKTAELGIQQGRLEEVQKVADEKAKNAAIQFQREQGFARDVASGVPVMEAWQRNPVSASILNSVSRSTVSGENKPIHVGDALVRRKPDGTFEEVYRSPTLEKPIKLGKGASLIRLDAQGNPHLVYGGETSSDLLGAVAQPAVEQPSLIRRGINAVFGAPKPPVAAPPAAVSKRITVKDKNGKKFTIPESQLDEAVSAGYTEAE